jgi:hypothetical protein
MMTHSKFLPHVLLSHLHPQEQICQDWWRMVPGENLRPLDTLRLSISGGSRSFSPGSSSISPSHAIVKTLIFTIFITHFCYLIFHKAKTQNKMKVFQIYFRTTSRDRYSSLIKTIFVKKITSTHQIKQIRSLFHL